MYEDPRLMAARGYAPGTAPGSQMAPMPGRPTTMPVYQPQPMGDMGGGSGYGGGAAQIGGMGPDYMARLRQMLGGMGSIGQQGGDSSGGAWNQRPMPGMAYAGGSPNFNENMGAWNPQATPNAAMGPRYAQPMGQTSMPGQAPGGFGGGGWGGSTLSQMLSRARPI